MCTNAKYIYNKYINKRILVDCGKCESCLQQKADARSNRIRYNLKKGEICLFVTLTYDNGHVPYIDLRQLKKGVNENVPVYRRCDTRSVRVGSDYHTDYVTKHRQTELYRLPYFNYNPKDSYKNLNGLPSYCVGLCWYPDVQMFLKRLRINLKRKINYNEKFTYFCCSEYGGTSHRPHFHLLLFIKREHEAAFRRFIVESWQYADPYRTRTGIEIARDCASYVSSYVNSNSSLPQGLTLDSTRQKHSYSKGFGVGMDNFLLTSLLDKLERNDMSFRRVSSLSELTSVCNLPIPKYVINRFFPRFKGYSRRDIMLKSEL